MYSQPSVSFLEHKIDSAHLSSWKTGRLFGKLKEVSVRDKVEPGSDICRVFRHLIHQSLQFAYRLKHSNIV